MGLLKESAKVFSGVTLQRLISLLMLPVIARLIGPDDYGVFHASLSICTLFFVMGGLSLEASIAVAETAEKAARRTLGSGLIGLLSGMVFLGVVMLIKPLLIIWFSEKIVHAIVWMTPILVPLTIISNSLRNFAGYLGKFGHFAMADIVSTVVNFIVIGLSYVFIWHDYRALVAGAVAGLTIKIILLYWGADCHNRFKDLFNFLDIIREIKQMRRYIQFYLPSNALNAYSAELPTILLAWFFPEAVVGVFIMAKSLIMMPTVLCSQALGQVFYPKAAKNYRDHGNLSEITWQSFIYASMFSIFPALFMAAGSITIIPVFLGDKWLGTLPYMLLLLPMVIFKAIETQIGIGFVFSILNQLKKILVGNLILFACRFIPFLMCLFFRPSPYEVVLIYSLGSAVGYIYLTGWVLITVGVSLRKAGGAFIQYCLYSFVCVLPIFLTYVEGGKIVAVLALSLSFLSYTAAIWYVFFNSRQRSDVISKTRHYLYKEKQPNKRQ